jgi:NADPH:quinone reductase-like Zn-dependent oxidoreductase
VGSGQEALGEVTGKIAANQTVMTSAKDTRALNRRVLLKSAASAGVALSVPALAASNDKPKPSARAPANARAWRLGEQRSIESLRLEAQSLRPLHDDEALIRVQAAALNHRDLLIAQARYGKAKPPERVPLGDGAGIVVDVGAGVSVVKIGERVSAPHFSTWLDGAYSPQVYAADLGNAADGWLADYLILPALSLVKIPASLSFAEAAALPAAGITAWTVMHSFARMKAGDTVLVLGTGGVSIIALQLARMAGARVAITSSSDEKLAIARTLGADITINYRRQPEWQDEVLAQTGGRGVDIVVETVGWATIERSAACCAPNGRIGLLGALATPAATVNPAGLMIRKNLLIKGITSGSARELAEVFAAFQANQVRPKVDRIFAFDEAPAAYRYLDSAEHVGKVVIQVAGAAS